MLHCESQAFPRFQLIVKKSEKRNSRFTSRAAEIIENDVFKCIDNVMIYSAQRRQKRSRNIILTDCSRQWTRLYLTYQVDVLKRRLLYQLRW